MIVEEFKSAISFGNSDLNIFTISENVVSFVSSSHKRKGPWDLVCIRPDLPSVQPG